MAAPVSSLTRLERGDGLTPDDNAGQDRRTVGDSSHDETATAAQFQRRARWRQSGGGGSVTAGRQACGFAGGVDTPHLYRQGRCSGEAEQRDGDQTGDGQRRFDCAEATIGGYTLVVSARLMMLVSAPTIESPVTTL